MKQDNLMIDIESMSTLPNAAVVTIGACMFDPFGGADQPITEKFHVAISMISNQRYGLHFDADTLEWWFHQDPEAISGLFENVTNIDAAFPQFCKWFQHETTYRPEQCWANDPDFDVVILREAYRLSGHRWPIFFSLNRSVRTAGAMAYPDSKERKAVMTLLRDQGTRHRADDDAVAQALFVAHCYEKLGIE